MLAIAAVATFFLTAIMAMAESERFYSGSDLLGTRESKFMQRWPPPLLNAISTSVSTTTFIRKRLVEWRLALPF
jgi:hypothetical protein